MTHLYQKKEQLLYQLKQTVEHFGLTHPQTVKKSQELDALINQVMGLNQAKEKAS